MGYPPVPQSAAAYFTLQTGEIVNPWIDMYTGTSEHFLYSATARPGNSGGPIVGADGRVLGIVTRDLIADPASPRAPFYAGIPTRVIVDALQDFDQYRNVIPVEDWT